MLVLLVVVFLMSNHAKNVGAEVLDFTFHDNSGHVIRSTHAAEDLDSQNKDPKAPMVLLIATPSLDNQTYVKQTALLNQLNSVSPGLVPVVACPQTDNIQGFHTDVNTTAGLNEINKPYRSYLLDSTGRIIKAFKGVIAPEALKKAITKDQEQQSHQPETASLATATPA